jgi:hypothetical protein
MVEFEKVKSFKIVKNFTIFSSKIVEKSVKLWRKNDYC